jgi:hypothetical protein
MTVRTRPELEAAAVVIRDETSEGANTAARVGGFLRDAVDSMPLATEVTSGALSRVLFVDSNSAVTPANGSIRAPFTTLQAAHDAATANSTIVVIACSTGVALSVTKSLSILPWRALIERPFAGYARAGENVSVGAVTVAAGVVLTVTGMNTTTFALPSGGTLNLGQGCDVNGAITGTGDIRISRADIHADITGSGVSIANSQIDTGVDITTSGTVVSLESVSFPGGAVSIVFSGSPGTVQMDPRTYEEWIAATETLTNGTIAVFGLPPEIPVSATLATSQNNWLPTGFAYGRYLRVDATSASLAVTGFSITGLAQGRKTIVNVGANAFTIENESVSSTAAHRIITPTGANYPVAVGVSIELFYDVTASRWRLIETPVTSAAPSGSAGGALTGTYPNPGIGDGQVTNARRANMADGTVSMRPTGAGSGVPQDVAISALGAMMGIAVVHEFFYNGGGTQSWTKPPGATGHMLLAVGGGGAGGQRSGGKGGGGGGPGAIRQVTLPAVLIPDELDIAVGNGGIGGSGVMTSINDGGSGFAWIANGGQPGDSGTAGGSGGGGGNNSLNGSSATGGTGGTATGTDGASGIGAAGGSGGANSAGKGGFGYGAGGGGGGTTGESGGGGASGLGNKVTADPGDTTNGGNGEPGYAAIVSWVSSWYPELLGSDLVLHLDAAKDVNTGTGGVSSWDDQTAFAFNATQGTTGIRPDVETTAWYGNYPSINFSGETTGDYLIADGVAPEFAGDDTPYTITWVGQVIGDPTGMRVILCVGATANDFALIRLAVNASNQWEAFSRDDANSASRTITGGTYDTNRHQHTIRFNGATFQYWVDGVSQGSSATALGTGTFTRFTIGGMRRSSGVIESPINMRSVGLFVAQRALTDAELAYQWDYSRRRFGGLP